MPRRLAPVAPIAAERIDATLSPSRYRLSESLPRFTGCHIHRTWATSLGRRGTWTRMADYLSFYGGALFKALLLPRFDVVVTLTTPPLSGFWARCSNGCEGRDTSRGAWTFIPTPAWHCAGCRPKAWLAA